MFEDPKVVHLPAARFFTAWLCYGATKNGALSHALWGLPSGAEAETWLARRDALNSVRATVVSPEVKRPQINPRDKMKFRDEVQEALERQQKGDAESGGE